MEKLTIEHLAPYLPYGLECELDFEDGDKKIFEVDMISCAELEYYTIDGDNYSVNDTSIKPILRPLSDLTKEIEHNGEKFVPIHFLDRKYTTGIAFPEHWIESHGMPCVSEMDSQPYFLLQHLFEWHFDVFGLIPKGLAIDISILK